MFQKWLLLVVVIAFFATTLFLWKMQTELSQRNTLSLLELNIGDVKQDIQDASDENLLALTASVARAIDEQPQAIDPDMLEELCREYDLSEINLVDQNGVIVVSTNAAFHGYNMAEGEQSSAFLTLLDGAGSYVQEYRPISYNIEISRKYAGAALHRGAVRADLFFDQKDYFGEYQQG